MNERDELVSIVGDGHFKPPTHATSGPCCMRPEAIEQVADAILAAGYSKPRTITTAEELDALPNGSVIRTAGTDEYEPRVAVKLSNWNGSAEWDVADCEELSVMTGELDDLPATVLWEPK